MGLKDAAVPMLLFFVAILAIAQSAITINSYLTTNKPKDSGFKFSMAVLVIAICTLFGSGYFTYKAFGGGGAEVAENASAGDADAAAALAAKLGGINLPSTNEVAAAVPNVQAFTNVPTLRKAEADFKVAVEKTKTALSTLEESIDKRIADKVSALQQAAEVMALATSKGA
jgi:hypothetical protein